MKYRTSQKEKIVSEYLTGELSYRNLGLQSGINFMLQHLFSFVVDLFY